MTLEGSGVLNARVRISISTAAGPLNVVVTVLIFVKSRLEFTPSFFMDLRALAKQRLLESSLVKLTDSLNS